MPRIKLTQAFVDRAEPLASGKDEWLWDQQVAGLGLRVRASGKKSWVLSYRTGGRESPKKRVTLADGSLSLKDARDLAMVQMGQVARARQGEAKAPHEQRAHSRTEARRAREEAAKALSVADAYLQWLASLDGHVKPAVLTEYRAQLERYIAPQFGSRRVDSIEGGDVLRLHRDLRDRPTTANRVRSRLRTFFGWCEGQGIRPRHSNPAIDVRPYPERERERALSADQVKTLQAAIDRAERDGVPVAPEREGRRSGTALARPSRAAEMRARRAKPGVEASVGRVYTMKAPRAPRGPYTKSDTSAPRLVRISPTSAAALRFLLSSGWRRSEVLTLRWDYIDLQQGIVDLPDTKSGASRRVLSGAALQLLRAQPRVVGSSFVFPSARQTSDGEVGPITNLSASWYAVRHAAGLPDVRLHDLRHTFASLAVSNGVDLHLAGGLLGHKDLKSTQRYAKYSVQSLREGANAVASVLEGTDSSLRVEMDSPG